MLLSWTRGNYFRVGGANQINYGQLMVVGLIKSCINGKKRIDAKLLIWINMGLYITLFTG